jgi:ribosome biogenesis SPOUT family RNA methylase Rps3
VYLIVGAIIGDAPEKKNGKKIQRVCRKGKGNFRDGVKHDEP